MQFKKEDDVIKNLYLASTHDYLMIFTNFGRVYWIKVWQIPESGRKTKGKPLVNLMEDLKPGEKVAAFLKVVSFEEDASIFMITKKGVIKKTPLSLFSNPRRKGVWALGLDEGDEMVAAKLAHAGQQVMLFTYNGMAVRFDEGKVRSMGRMARGVRGVTLKSPEDVIVGCEVVNGNETILVICENGFGKRSAVEEFRMTNRGGVGVKSIITSDRNGHVIGALCVADNDSMVMMSSQGQTVRISMKDLRVLGRNTQGVKLSNLKDKDYLIAVQKIAGELQEETLEAAVVTAEATEK
jgi:DNA gyrase subunit A